MRFNRVIGIALLFLLAIPTLATAATVGDTFVTGLIKIDNFFTGQQYERYAKAIDFFVFFALLFAIYFHSVKFVFKELTPATKMIAFIMALMSAFLLVIGGYSIIKLVKFFPWLILLLLILFYNKLLQARVQSGPWRAFWAVVLALLTWFILGFFMLPQQYAASDVFTRYGMMEIPRPSGLGSGIPTPSGIGGGSGSVGVPSSLPGDDDRNWFERQWDSLTDWDTPSVTPPTQEPPVAVVPTPVPDCLMPPCPAPAEVTPSQEEGEEEAQEEPLAQDEGNLQEDDGSFAGSIGKYWWVLAIVALIALAVIRKMKKERSPLGLLKKEIREAIEGKTRIYRKIVDLIQSRKELIEKQQRHFQEFNSMDEATLWENKLEGARKLKELHDAINNFHKREQELNDALIELRELETEVKQNKLNRWKMQLRSTPIQGAKQEDATRLKNNIERVFESLYDPNTENGIIVEVERSIESYAGQKEEEEKRVKILGELTEQITAVDQLKKGEVNQWKAKIWETITSLAEIIAQERALFHKDGSTINPSFRQRVAAQIKYLSYLYRCVQYLESWAITRTIGQAAKKAKQAVMGKAQQLREAAKTLREGQEVLEENVPEAERGAQAAEGAAEKIESIEGGVSERVTVTSQDQENRVFSSVSPLLRDALAAIGSRIATATAQGKVKGKKVLSALKIIRKANQETAEIGISEEEKQRREAAVQKLRSVAFRVDRISEQIRATAERAKREPVGEASRSTSEVVIETARDVAPNDLSIESTAQRVSDQAEVLSEVVESSNLPPQDKQGLKEAIQEAVAPASEILQEPPTAATEPALSEQKIEPPKNVTPEFVLSIRGPPKRKPVVVEQPPAVVTASLQETAEELKKVAESPQTILPPDAEPTPEMVAVVKVAAEESLKDVAIITHALTPLLEQAGKGTDSRVEAEYPFEKQEELSETSGQDISLEGFAPSKRRRKNTLISLYVALQISLAARRIKRNFYRAGVEPRTLQGEEFSLVRSQKKAEEFAAPPIPTTQEPRESPIQEGISQLGAALGEFWRSIADGMGQLNRDAEELAKIEKASAEAQMRGEIEYNKEQIERLKRIKAGLTEKLKLLKVKMGEAVELMDTLLPNKPIIDEKELLERLIAFEEGLEKLPSQLRDWKDYNKIGMQMLIDDAKEASKALIAAVERAAKGVPDVEMDKEDLLKLWISIKDKIHARHTLIRMKPSIVRMQKKLESARVQIDARLRSLREQREASRRSLQEEKMGIEEDLGALRRGKEEEASLELQRREVQQLLQRAKDLEEWAKSIEDSRERQKRVMLALNKAKKSLIEGGRTSKKMSVSMAKKMQKGSAEAAVALAAFTETLYKHLLTGRKIADEMVENIGKQLMVAQGMGDGVQTPQEAKTEEAQIAALNEAIAIQEDMSATAIEIEQVPAPPIPLAALPPSPTIRGVPIRPTALIPPAPPISKKPFEETSNKTETPEEYAKRLGRKTDRGGGERLSAEGLSPAQQEFFSRFLRTDLGKVEAPKTGPLRDLHGNLIVDSRLNKEQEEPIAVVESLPTPGTGFVLLGGSSGPARPWIFRRGLLQLTYQPYKPNFILRDQSQPINQREALIAEFRSRASRLQGQPSELKEMLALPKPVAIPPQIAKRKDLAEAWVAMGRIRQKSALFSQWMAMRPNADVSIVQDAPISQESAEENAKKVWNKSSNHIISGIENVEIDTKDFITEWTKALRYVEMAKPADMPVEEYSKEQNFVNPRELQKELAQKLRDRIDALTLMLGELNKMKKDAAQFNESKLDPQWRQRALIELDGQFNALTSRYCKVPLELRQFLVWMKRGLASANDLLSRKATLRREESMRSEQNQRFYIGAIKQTERVLKKMETAPKRIGQEGANVIGSFIKAVFTPDEISNFNTFLKATMTEKEKEGGPFGFTTP